VTQGPPAGPEVVIVDYGMGNLRSVQKALEAVGARAAVTRDPGRVREAQALVLPGVGAFGDCMANLSAYGLLEPVRERALSETPFLGICLGYQLLFEESEEFGPHSGLGVLPGKVVRFPRELVEGGEVLKVPHMGWNRIAKRKEVPALADVPDGSYVYFVHSYYPVPAEPEVVATTTTYGLPFASSVARGNLFACQFHPEKSQKVGLALLRGFWSTVREKVPC
jgi:imidazole glycerol-phosphate synthase subunit HisH